MARYIIIAQYGPKEATDGYELPRDRDEAMARAVDDVNSASLILEISDDMVCSDISSEMAEAWVAKNATEYFAEELPIPQFIERHFSPRRLAEMRDEYHEESRYERHHVEAYSQVGL